jgi:hypothetical protein
MPDAPRIFFSYASEDGYWVEAFKNSTAFKSVVWGVRVLDYKAEAAGYGSLRAALDEQINRSAVVIAFVSRDYCRKLWTIAEWEQSLTEAQRRRLLFVPIMLDADATAWWKSQRKQGKLTSLSLDYSYVTFTDAGGGRLDIRPEDTQVNGMIARLARQIRDNLESDASLVAERVDPLPATASRPSAAPGVKEAADIVVLAHPKAALPQEMTAHIGALAEKLKDRGVRVELWKDGWRRKPEARGKAGVNSDTVFVQPLAESEAADMVSDRGATRVCLGEAGFPNAKVVLWLPAAFRDPDFEAAAASSADARTFPGLRVDAPDALADWLEGYRKHSDSADQTKIQIKTIGLTDGPPSPQSAASLRVVDQLRDQFIHIAANLVDPPPEPPPWEFWGNQFAEHLKRLPGNRTIIAIHDLDVTPDTDRSVEKQLQARFDEILMAVEKEQEARSKDGRPQLNAFLAALLVRTASALPFNEYPHDGRYGQWRLLGFAPPNGAGPGEEPPLEPNPASLAVFRHKLFSWAHPQPSAYSWPESHPESKTIQ